MTLNDLNVTKITKKLIYVIFITKNEVRDDYPCMERGKDGWVYIA